MIRISHLPALLCGLALNLGAQEEAAFTDLSPEQAREVELKTLRAVADLALLPPQLNTNPGEKYAVRNLDYGMTIGIERSPGGRLFGAWIGGGDDPEGHMLVARSDDDGTTWSDPILVIDSRADHLPIQRTVIVGNLWTDPQGRLWLFFDQVMAHYDGRAGLWATVCENPDAETIEWSTPRRLSHGVMLNKPIVTAKGEWLAFTYLLENPGYHQFKAGVFPELDPIRGVNVLVSTDEGATWTQRGNVKTGNGDWHEAMAVEKVSGDLWMLIRTSAGLVLSESTDGGRTWSEPIPSPGISHPNARFFLRKLASGRWLLVKHGDEIDAHNGRMKLSAWLSEDEGETWQGGLVFEGRGGVSYPDGFQAPDGSIYVSYDWQRSKRGHILFAQFTEEDILAGELVSDIARVRQPIMIPGKLNPNPTNDLAADRGETTDVFARHPEKVTGFQRKMRDGSEEVGTAHDFPSHHFGEALKYRKGARLFADRAYQAGQVPSNLSGMGIHLASIEGGDFEVVAGGEVVALTPFDPAIRWSQARKLEHQGFTRVEAIDAYPAWPGQPESMGVMRKTVSPGEVISYTKVCLLLLGEGVALKPVDPPGPWSENQGEVLYNGITLPKVWPPRHLDPHSTEPMPVPYLEHPPEIIPIDVGRQLFVDDFLIESTTLARTFHQPVKDPRNPVFRAETPTEMAGDEVVYLGQGGLFWDPVDQHYKLFYTAGWRGPIAMATSTDLIHWERPAIAEDGSNHLLPAGTVWQGVEGRVAGGDNAVWYDALADDPMNRIRFLACWLHGGKENRPEGFSHSLQRSDGETWSDAVPASIAGDYGSFFYNPFRQKWIHSIKMSSPRGRARHYLETDEFLDGTAYPASVYWTNADRLDLPEPADTYPGDPAPCQLYSLAGVAYESLLIGMHQIHRGPPNGVCHEGHFPKLTDLEVGFSRDGFHWHRPDRSGFIRGERTEGAWDRAYVHTTTGVFVVHEDELVFPYCAYSGETSTGHRDVYAGASIGLARLRRDGFASMDAGKQGGELTTRPVRFSGKELFVNSDALDGELRVEVLDLDGTVLRQSIPFARDTTAERILWEEESDLESLDGHAVRFRFRLVNGSLYSFWISPDENGHSNGFLGAGGSTFSSLRDEPTP